ncbi:hypothetical protein C8J57DRAFT_1329435, partial [Mycena rebaudengoi]
FGSSLLQICCHLACAAAVTYLLHTPNTPLPVQLFTLLPPVANPYHPINLPVMHPNVLPDAFTHRSISNSVCIIIGPTIICMFFLVSVPTFSDSLLLANFTVDHINYIFDGAGGGRFGVHTA